MAIKAESFEDLARRVWGDKISLGLATKAIGGIGLGLLVSRKAKFRPLAFGMLAFAMISNTYALLTMKHDVSAKPGEPSEPSKPGQQPGQQGGQGKTP